MPSINQIFATVAVAIVILVAATVGVVFLLPQGHHALPAQSSTTSSHPIPTTTTTTTTTVITSHSTSNPPPPPSYSLALAGNGKILTSNMTTPQPLTSIANDTDLEYYFDGSNSNPWVLDGDFEPGSAWFVANSSGLSFIHETQNGPFHEWWGDHEENITGLYATRFVPSNSGFFTMYVNIPYYSFINTCQANKSDTGCSYEGGGLPALIVDYALTASNGSNASTVFMTLSEVPGGMQVGVLTSEFSNTQYIGGKDLYYNFIPYSPAHKLTIATDRETYLKVYLDNTLLYSSPSGSLPVNLAGNTLQVGFQQNTNMNNVTLSTTWNNLTVYANPFVTVQGLSSGMSILVQGAGGFSASAPAGANGIAAIDVTLSPNDLTVSVEMNGSIITTYTGVSIGDVLTLVTS